MRFQLQTMQRLSYGDEQRSKLILLKTSLSITQLSIFMVCAIALAGCQPAQIPSVAAAEPAVHVTDDAQAYRWQAMADFYKKADLLTRYDFGYEFQTPFQGGSRMKTMVNGR